MTDTIKTPVNFTTDNAIENDLLAEIQSDETGLIEVQPYIQVINVKNVNSKSAFGLFITKENAEQCDFEPDGQMWKPHSHSFSTDTEPTEGYISQHCRMLVLNNSQLGVFNKEDNRFIGYYNDVDRDRALTYCKLKYLVILLDSGFIPMHVGSLGFSTRGVFSTSFGQKFRDFKKDFCKLIKSNRTGNIFWSNIVFDFETKPEMRGETKSTSSAVTIVDSYFVPTVEFKKPEPKTPVSEMVVDITSTVSDSVYSPEDDDFLSDDDSGDKILPF